MIDNHKISYKISELVARLLFLKPKGVKFFSNKRADVLIKIIVKYENNKVLMGKQIKEDSISKVCLPAGYVDLDHFEDNLESCIKIAFDNLNLHLDIIDFQHNNLIDVYLNHSFTGTDLVYVYEYVLDEREVTEISNSCSMYDFFFFDFSELEMFNKKKRFVDHIDYRILKNYSRRIV